MDWSFFCVFLLGLISGVVGGGYGYDAYNGVALDYYSKPKYSFGYEVEDYYKALSHGRWETRDGDLTQGQYRVLLPDGRLQIVSYIANKHGYFPTVEYIGKSVHPPPPPVYAKVKVPKILQALPIAAPIQPAIVKQHQLVGGYYNDPYGVYGPNYPGVYGGYPVDPLYAAGSDNAQVQQQQQQQQQQHLLYDRTLFRRDLEDSNNPNPIKNKKKRRRVRKIRIVRKTPKLAEVQPISESETKISNQ